MFSQCGMSASTHAQAAHTRSIALSFTRPFIHLLTHSLTHPPTNPPIHSHTQTHTQSHRCATHKQESLSKLASTHTCTCTHARKHPHTHATARARSHARIYLTHLSAHVRALEASTPTLPCMVDGHMNTYTQQLPAPDVYKDSTFSASHLTKAPWERASLLGARVGSCISRGCSVEGAMLQRGAREPTCMVLRSNM